MLRRSVYEWDLCMFNNYCIQHLHLSDDYSSNLLPILCPVFDLADDEHILVTLYNVVRVPMSRRSSPAIATSRWCTEEVSSLAGAIGVIALPGRIDLSRQAAEAKLLE